MKGVNTSTSIFWREKHLSTAEQVYEYQERMIRVLEAGRFAEPSRHVPMGNMLFCRNISAWSAVNRTSVVQHSLPIPPSLVLPCPQFIHQAKANVYLPR